MFENMTVNELKVVCKLFRIDLGTATKKADILSLLGASGFTYEDYAIETNQQFSQEDALPKEKEKVVVKDETKSDSIVLKMTYPRGQLNVSNKAEFTIEEPFKIFTKEKAEEILRLAQGEVVVATPEEIASFYNIKK